MAVLSIYVSNTNNMKKILLIILLLFAFIYLNAQTYDKKVVIRDFGTWNKIASSITKISISSYVTKQNILINNNQKQNIVSDTPKYRYELILTSKSTYGGKLSKTWLYGVRVFINNSEITREQFPKGFTAIIETTPTTIYWYETSLNSINIKITWQNSVCFGNNN